MQFSRLTHPIISLLLFVTYVGGSFIGCSPHHTYANEEKTSKIERENESTHHHKDISSSHSENDDEQDDHCKEGKLDGTDIYVHKDSFHDLAQVGLLPMIPVTFFMAQEKNDAYFYRESIGIYRQQLYDSEVAYASERKNVIEVLI